MEKKKNIIIWVLAVILLLAAGFICYDKFLKKTETVSKDCDCPKCEKVNNTCDLKVDYVSGEYEKKTLTAKYVNVGDKESTIQFNSDGTWSASRNSCHFYEDLNGTYTINENNIVLHGGSETTLTIVSGYTDGIYLLYTNSSDEDISGCSVSNYYAISK